MTIPFDFGTGMVMASGGWVEDFFFRWTILLLSVWAIHAWVRRRDPRLRLLLWRTALVATLILPVIVALPELRWPLPVAQRESKSDFANRGDGTLPVANTAALQPGDADGTIDSTLKRAVDQTAAASRGSELQVGRHSRGWLVWGCIWAAGGVLGVIRLFRLRQWVRRLIRASEPAPSSVEFHVQSVAADLALHVPVRVRLVSGIAAPFVTGLWRPTLVLPSHWCTELSSEEWDAMLRHELAHVRGRDIGWAMGWRCLLILGWPHPLLWGVGRVHRLACEEEADRFAAELGGSRPLYAQQLSQLVMRAVGHPASLVGLLFQASSDLGHRLDRLDEPAPSTLWRRRASLIGVLILVVLLGSATWRLVARSSRVHQVFHDLQVSVVDESGRPINGAILKPDGLREHHNTASHYSWNPEQHGARTLATTDSQGHAILRYPEYVSVDDHLRTVKISFSVNHPDYSPVRPTDFPVDGSGDPIQLRQGARVEVTGFFGEDHRPVKDLVLNLGGENRWKWVSDRTGRYVCNQVTSGPAMIQAMGLLPDGRVGFSKAQLFQAKAGEQSILSLELKPGIRLEGRLDESVPRPVRNGRVVICVRPPELPAFEPDRYYKLRIKYGDFHPWSTHQVIDEDGRFVFESLPPGEASLTVHGDGFCSKAGALVPEGAVPPSGFGVPQSFPLVAPVTHYTVETEATSTIRFRVVDLKGVPVRGATLYMDPNVLLLGTGIFGDVDHHRHGEEPFATPPALPSMPYSAVTDSTGLAILHDVPAFTAWFDLDHSRFVLREEVGGGGRVGRIQKHLKPGATNDLEVVVEPKGRTFLGDSR